MKKKKIILFVVLIVIIGLISGVFFGWKQYQEKQSDAIEISAGEGEEMIYLSVANIVGNELEGTMMDDASASRDAMGERNDENMPQRERFDNMPEGGASGVRDERPDRMGSEGSRMEEQTSETVSLQIPVGTPVITRLGVETTFSRISAGNSLAILREAGTENILKIWIVE